MKSRFNKFLFILPILTLVSSCSTLDISNHQESNIKIAIANSNYAKMKRLTDSLEQKDHTLHFTYEIADERKLNYYLRHNQLDADIICLEDFKGIELSSNLFVDLSTSEYVNRFSKYIQNNLSSTAKEGEDIYCLPSPGGFYCYCVNNDLFEQYNLSIPSSFSTLIDYATNMKGILLPFASSFEGDETYLDAFMQASIPSFFAYPIGYSVFNDFYNGVTAFKDSKYYLDLLKNINNNYRSLYSSKFINPNISTKDGIIKFFDGDSLMMSVSPSFDFETEYNKAREGFSYSFLPYLGSNEDEAWLPATSDFFVSVFKKSFETKDKAINKLLDYFSSREGQEILLTDQYGDKSGNRISYLNDNAFELNGNYQALNSVIKKGKIYFVDKFYYAFKDNLDSFKSFIQDSSSASTLVSELDDEMSMLNNYNYNKIYIEGFDGKGKLEENGKEMMAEILKEIKTSQNSLTCVFLEDSFIKENVFEGMIYENELNTVFDETATATFYQFNGTQLKNLISNLTADFSGYGFVNRNGTYMTNDLQQFVDNKTYRILVSDKLTLDDSFYTQAKKDTINVLSILKNIWFENR